MPGPLLVAVIEQTALQGMRAVVGLIAGHALLELVIVLMLVAGLHTVIGRAKVRGTIAVLGGAALVYMGVDMIRNATSLNVDLTRSASAAASWPKLLLLGATISAANPYFTGWWATIGAGQLAQMAPRTVREYACFYLGHETSDYVWYIFVGLLIITGRRWLNGPVYHGLILFCAAAIVLIGVWFLCSGIGLLRPKRKEA